MNLQDAILDTEYLQQKIDTAHGEFTIGPANPRTGLAQYTLCKALTLPENFTLYIKDCTLRLADGVYENMLRGKNVWQKDGTLQNRLHNIRIIGVGNAVLDGGSPNDLTERTCGRDGKPDIHRNIPILLHNTDGFCVCGLTIKNQRYWGITLLYCQNGSITDICFDANNTMPNQDGIDLRCGCSHIDISHITGKTGDDSVALTALPLGSEQDWAVPGLLPDIHHITISDISTFITGGHQCIRLLCHDGAKIYNVCVRGVTDVSSARDVQARATVVLGDNHYHTLRRALPGDICDISVSDISSRAKAALEIRWPCVKNLSYDGVVNTQGIPVLVTPCGD